MAMTLQQSVETSDVAEPSTEGPDWAPRWNAWARTPQGKEALRRQAVDALDFYDRVIKPRYEPHDNGKYVVVELDSKKYEIASTSTEARNTLRKRGTDGHFVTMEIGRPLVRISRGPLVELRVNDP